ncbi:MAG: DUF2505 domain-containing protein [Deltaproteobacteria bacterium]|nr:MAG: DUF2505 domain-containing protein [Deltaproteobacteria bacterium]
MRFRIEDAFDTDPETYWEAFFSDAYNEGLWPALDMGWELRKLEREGEGPDLVIRREQVLTPRRELPGFLRKFVQGALAYTERNVFRARDSAMEVETIPSVLPDKLESRGVYRVEPAGPGRCLRIYEGEVRCTLPLVGGKVEKQLVSEIEESYRKATDFTRRFLAERGA